MRQSRGALSQVQDGTYPVPGSEFVRQDGRAPGRRYAQGILGPSDPHVRLHGAMPSFSTRTETIGANSPRGLGAKTIRFAAAEIASAAI